MSKDSQFENIKTQINMKLIKPHEEEEIINKININKKKRNSFNINSNNFVKVIAANVQKKLNSDPSKDKINNIQNIKSINPFIIQEDKSQNQNNKTTITNNNKINFGYNNITIPNNLPNSLDKITFGVNQGQKNISEKNKINVSESEPFSSAQIERQKLSIDMNQNVNNYNTDLLNKKNKISFLNSNKIEPPFINNINNISSISNINNSSDISN